MELAVSESPEQVLLKPVAHAAQAVSEEVQVESVEHLRLPGSSPGESVIELRVRVPPSAFETMPLIGYVMFPVSKFNVPAPQTLVTLALQVLKGLVKKALAAALPREEAEVKLAAEQLLGEHDADAMLSKRTELKHGTLPEKFCVTSTAPS